MTGEGQRTEVEEKRVGGGGEKQGEIRLMTLKAAKWLNHQFSKRSLFSSLSPCHHQDRSGSYLLLHLVLSASWFMSSDIIKMALVRNSTHALLHFARTHTHTPRHHRAAQSLPAHPVLSRLRQRSFLITLNHKPWIRKNHSTLLSSQNCHIALHARRAHDVCWWVYRLVGVCTGACTCVWLHVCPPSLQHIRLSLCNHLRACV